MGLTFGEPGAIGLFYSIGYQPGMNHRPASCLFLCSRKVKHTMLQSSLAESFKENWRRFESHGKTVYVSAKDACWFVPTPDGDKILSNLEHAGDKTLDPDTRFFLSSLPSIRKEPYQGIKAHPALSLNELWFHITSRCNLSCTHCLFSSAPENGKTLCKDTIMALAREAHQNGCRMFALTGGEPFVHPEIDDIITGLLSLPGSHVAVLTNGMTVVPHIERLKPDPEFFHLQISVDGLEQNHDRIRGKGSFQRLSENLLKLKARSFPVTLSMCVTRNNVTDMPGLIDFSAEKGASNVHFMWYFIKGRGEKHLAPDTASVFENMMLAADRARQKNITIDNLESLKTQVFAPPGTIHDGSSAGWESLAVGPDGRLYPSAALVGTPELESSLDHGLMDAFHRSPVLKAIRSASILNHGSDFRYILGGGDLDHSYVHQQTFMGDDPYQGLHERLVLWLISEEAGKAGIAMNKPAVLLQMGDILESCGAHGETAFVHSNCLLAAARNNSLTTVKNFYSSAVGDTRADILNPVCYDPVLLDHIPEQYRFRGYGCGSPVLDAGIAEGDHVADLGCGSGVECFIAARLTGGTGRVTGVDMLSPMLDLAEQARGLVEKNLSYRNLSFKNGYLENLPLEDGSVDTVISNCVMNLSVNKIRAYAEIFRVLRPGGKLVISDVVCETEPGPVIRNNETLKGECIAGALTESRLMALLGNTGFSSVVLVKRFPYRNVGGHDFYSLTYKAVKPLPSSRVKTMYRGPLPYLTTLEGSVLFRGMVSEMDAHEAENLGDQIFVLDESGLVKNIETENTCACYRPPEQPRPDKQDDPAIRHTMGCMVCGASLSYHADEQVLLCHYCNREFQTCGVCENGHFVCDQCHAKDGLSVIRHICVETGETDMLKLFEQLRRHPAIPMHGPEYHAMIPGIILACYRNLGGPITDETVLSGITRGSTVAGGFCGFMGICGAAVGVGVAFSLILQASPVKGEERRMVQTVTQKVLKEIAGLNAARCCQRDGFIALKKAAELSKDYLSVELTAHHELVCRQRHKNRECPGRVCPLFDRSEKQSLFVM
jgi:MoaA/NifB/PqqE/SkfB family radical SAM enzyme/SAM-dependent methyltransferase